MDDRRHFDFEIKNLNDVTKHLDALWYEFNKLIKALNSQQPCTDPPNTCGFQDEQQQEGSVKEGAA